MIIRFCFNSVVAKNDKKTTHQQENQKNHYVRWR
jgi:hypothetical protein